MAHMDTTIFNCLVAVATHRMCSPPPLPPPPPNRNGTVARDLIRALLAWRRGAKSRRPNRAHTRTHAQRAHTLILFAVPNDLIAATRVDARSLRRRFVRKLSAQLALELVSTVVLLAGVALSCGSRTANPAQLGISHTYTHTHTNSVCVRLSRSYAVN